MCCTAEKMELIDSDDESDLLDEDVPEENEDDGKMTLEEARLILIDLSDTELKKNQKRKSKWGPC